MRTAFVLKKRDDVGKLTADLATLKKEHRAELT
jgi:hypothetical protein